MKFAATVPYLCPRRGAQGLFVTLIGGGGDMTDLDDARAMTHVFFLGLVGMVSKLGRLK